MKTKKRQRREGESVLINQKSHVRTQIFFFKNERFPDLTIFANSLDPELSIKVHIDYIGVRYAIGKLVQKFSKKK